MENKKTKILLVLGVLLLLVLLWSLINGWGWIPFTSETKQAQPEGEESVTETSEDELDLTGPEEGETDSAPGVDFCKDNKDSTTKIDGDLVYCDNDLRMWSTTSNDKYKWYDGSKDNPDNPDDSCVGDGSDYPACNYCDTLDYAGYTDWQLPDITTVCAFGKDVCGWSDCKNASDGCYPSWESRDNMWNHYWSSTENTSNSALNVLFFTGLDLSKPKTNSHYVRCVRGE